MNSILVLIFSDENGAYKVASEIQALQERQLICIVDAAEIIRNKNNRLNVKQVSCLGHSDGLGGAYWGLLIGLLVYLPWLGVNLRDVTQALETQLTDFGLTYSFIYEVGAAILPGSSALFTIASEISETKLIEVLSRHKATLLRKMLSENDECNLKEAFSAEGL